MVEMNEKVKLEDGVQDEGSGDKNSLLLRRCANELEKDRCMISEWEAYMTLSSAMLHESLGIGNKEEDNDVSTKIVEGSVRDGYEAWNDIAGKAGQMRKASQTWILSRALEKASTLGTSTADDSSFRDILQVTNLMMNTNAGEKDQKSTTPDWLWKSFDNRVKEIRTYYAKFNSSNNNNSNKRRKLHQITSENNTENYNDKGNPEADGYDLKSWVISEMEDNFGFEDGKLFSEEEVMGKYLDLHSFHEQYGLLFKDEEKIPYADYCTTYIASIPPKKQPTNRKLYMKYLSSLQSYLISFLKRTSPLLDIQRDIIKPASGEKSDMSMEQKQNDIMDFLKAFNTPQNLNEQVTPEVLKERLAMLGLKCGGTPLDRAKRLFLCKSTPLSQLPSKNFANKNNMSAKEIQQKEKVLIALFDQLRPTLDATARRVERALTQTITERQRELEEEMTGLSHDHATITQGKLDSDQEGEDDDEDDEDAPIYNPKGVPLGWDGKPIPYWLFKLHGLNHFYVCEICGNESYRGRRNFEKHFTEAKHSYGMKCLGIPNTQHFHGITKIEDAQALWKKLQSRVQNDLFDGEKEEEYEDSHGNVLTRATYEDLARQGLL